MRAGIDSRTPPEDARLKWALEHWRDGHGGRIGEQVLHVEAREVGGEQQGVR